MIKNTDNKKKRAQGKIPAIFLPTGKPIPIEKARFHRLAPVGNLFGKPVKVKINITRKMTIEEALIDLLKDKLKEHYKYLNKF